MTEQTIAGYDDTTFSVRPNRPGACYMSEAEFSQALQEKLLEEAQETAGANPQDLVSELADLQEVMDALLAVYGIEREDVLKEQRRKRTERGGFERRIRLLWTDS
jgi:predicted house-cleaning noncanonical NTP pyrophosphatase (MazG superfamily)